MKGSYLVKLIQLMGNTLEIPAHHKDADCLCMHYYHVVAYHNNGKLLLKNELCSDQTDSFIKSF